MGVPKRLKPQSSRAVRSIAVGMLCLAAVQCRPLPPAEHVALDIHALERKELAYCAKTLVPLAQQNLLGLAGLDWEKGLQQRINDEATVLTHVLLVHDKQKVIVNGEYGAMACAAAVVRHPNPPPNTFNLVALVEVKDGPVPTGWLYGPELTTCVYLNLQEPQPKALLRPTRDGNCPPILETPKEGDIIENVLLERPTAIESHYPPMVRWDFNPETGMMYLGTTCGTGWCTIAPKNTRLSPGITSGPEHLRIKGWYDEQFVARRVSSSTDSVSLIPSRLILRIMPHEVLGSRWKHAAGSKDVPTDQLGSPQHVATIHVPNPVLPGADTALEQYARRWGHPVPQVQPGTVLHVKMNLLSNEVGEGRYELPGPVTSQSLGWRQFERKPDPGNVADALRALEVPKGPYLPLGIARWGWDENDESAWVRCGYGCCRVVDPL
jgi:hypothetical protein